MQALALVPRREQKIKLPALLIDPGEVQTLRGDALQLLVRQFLLSSRNLAVSACSRSDCASGSFASAIVRNLVGLTWTFRSVLLQIAHSWLRRPALTASPKCVLIRSAKTSAFSRDSYSPYAAST